jgi:heat shock protein HslJ
VKYTISFLLPLTLLLFLAVGCATTPSDTPLLSPSSAARSVLVRVQNQSDFDLESLRLQFPDKNNQQIQIPFLAAGEASAYFPLTEIYQSAAVEATIAGQRYTIEALDLGAESPITGGSYIYLLQFQNETLTLEFQLETEGRQLRIEPLVERLIGGGATVLYELSVPRETLFDRLWGEPVTAPELLQVNGQRLWVYVFDDTATAEAAAETIEAGGTSFIYTRSNGTEVREFMGGVGAKTVWWQWEQYILFLGEFAPAESATIDLISGALGREPLHAETLNGTEVQLRLANMSGIDFERVIVNVMGRETDYGALPRGGVSAYHPQNGIYRYADVKVIAEGRTYQFIPIDFMGETPLSGGNYTYALELIEVDTQVSILHLSDDVQTSDPALLGKWFWSNAQLADGTFMTPDSDGEEQPHLVFTDTPDPNQAGFSFTGYGGCNALFGSYLITPIYGFVTGGVGGTQALCGESVMASETLLQAALTGIVAYQVQGKELFLYIPGGSTLTFVRE